MEPLVSIIITTYNRADIISETIESCLKQTYKNFEVIIIDDGSTDNTAAVISHYLPDGRLRYIHKPNEERAIARNAGAAEAKGIYLKFLDSDDLIAKDYLLKTLSFFQNHPDCDLIYTNCKNLTEERITLLSKKDISRNTYAKLWDDNDIAFSSVIMKKDSFLKTGGFDTTRSLSGAEDWEFWVRISKSDLHFGFVADYLTTIRSHASNGTMNDVNKIVDSGNVAVALLSEKFADITDKQKKKFAARMLALQAIYANMQARKTTSIHFLCKALIANPALLLKKSTAGLVFRIILPNAVANKIKNRVMDLKRSGVLPA